MKYTQLLFKSANKKTLKFFLTHIVIFNLFLSGDRGREGKGHQVIRGERLGHKYSIAPKIPTVQ